MIVQGLKKVEDAQGGKVVLEKPFGESLEAAAALNEKMEAFFSRIIFTVSTTIWEKKWCAISRQSALPTPIFSNVWDAEHIECIQISALEEVGVETRGGYYDHSGALKDMMQNHLFQILSIVAMEQPRSPAVEDMHQEQMKVLAALVMPEDISGSMVLGQYEGYRGEPSVAAGFPYRNPCAAVRLLLDNERWKGMPFISGQERSSGKGKCRWQLCSKVRHRRRNQYPEHQDTAYGRSISAVQYQETGEKRRKSFRQKWTSARAVPWNTI